MIYARPVSKLVNYWLHLAGLIFVVHSFRDCNVIDILVTKHRQSKVINQNEKDEWPEPIAMNPVHGITPFTVTHSDRKSAILTLCWRCCKKPVYDAVRDTVRTQLSQHRAVINVIERFSVVNKQCSNVQLRHSILQIPQLLISSDFLQTSLSDEDEDKLYLQKIIKLTNSNSVTQQHIWTFLNKSVSIFALIAIRNQDYSWT